MYNCKTCNREFEKKSSVTNHEKTCSIKVPFVCDKCGHEIKTSINRHINSCNGKGPRRHKPTLYSGIYGGWQKGKTYDEIYGVEKSNQMKMNLSEKGKGSLGKGLTEEKETQRKDKIRKSINERYAAGWDSICGRCKKYDYVSKVAGNIKVDGTWELSVAKYLDSINVIWARPTERFTYINLIGKESTYKPDFYVKDWDSYIEVKGYETDLDKCKWSQFPNKLMVWKKQDLIRLNILESNP